MRLRLMTGLLVLAAAVGQAVMQDDTSVTIRSDTRLVEIDVSVRDSRGHSVENLEASDFTVTDNGKPRSFTTFSATHSGSALESLESPKGLPQRPVLPPNVFTNADAAAMPPEGHSTILLLDGENGWFENAAYARQGVLGLLAKLPADEKIALYVLLNNKGMGILQDYTVDRSKVSAALAKFIPPNILPSRSSFSSGSRGEISGYTHAAMRSASEDVRVALNALAQQLKNVPGRKSVFWITQGFPSSELRDEKENWDKTTAALNDANIAVNTVDSDGLNPVPPIWGPGQMLTLQQIADETGGQAYVRRNDLDGAMASGVAASRSSYTLGFYLTELDGKFHQLKVNVNRPNLQLNYRQGYYAQTDAVKDAGGEKSTLAAALLNPSVSADVRITARLDIIPGSPRATLKTRLILASEPLSLQSTGSGYTGKVEELFLELNAAGREVGRYSDSKEFTVRAASKAIFDTQGAILSQAIPLEASAVKVSIVVRDTASGRTGSLVIPLDQVTPQKPAH